MVEWHKLFHLCQHREGQRMGERAMPPADIAGIFFVAVLRVMDEQIRTRGNGVA